MKSILLNSSNKFQRKNLNKFLYLKKKNSEHNLISSKPRILKSKTIEMIEFFFKKNISLKVLRIINCNKTKTKKPLGSKLGGGKGKVDSFFKVLKKYQPIIIVNQSSNLKPVLKYLNKIL